MNDLLKEYEARMRRVEYKNDPRGVSKKAIIDEFVKRGHTKDEINESLLRLSRLGMVTVCKETQSEQEEK